MIPDIDGRSIRENNFGGICSTVCFSVNFCNCGYVTVEVSFRQTIQHNSFELQQNFRNHFYRYCLHRYAELLFQHDTNVIGNT